MSKYLCILFVFGCLGCASTPELPIPKDKMAQILKDMLVAEAAMQRVGRSKKDTLQKLYYNQIYKIHEVDSAALAQSFQRMQEDPDLSQALYEKAEQLLVDQETSIKERIEKERIEQEKKDEEKDQSETTEAMPDEKNRASN